MMSYIYYVIVLITFVVIISIPLTIIANKKRKREIESVFEKRQELTERDFYETHFQNKGTLCFVVRKIRQILEEVFDADLLRLSSKDDFSKNLNFFWQEDSLADVEIIEQIEEEFNIKFYQADFEHLNSLTVEQIVDCTWNKVREKEN
jgi:acyl carrier protein